MRQCGGSRVFLSACAVLLAAGTIFAGVGPYPPDANTVALYHFENDFQDSSGNLRHLSVVDNGGYFGFADSRPGWGLGKALYVSGTSSDGSYLRSTQLAYPGTGGWTVEALIYVPGANSAQLPIQFSSGVASHDPYQMDYSGATQEISWRIDDSGGTRREIFAPLSYGRWHHVAGVFDDSQDKIKLYIDGLMVDEQPAPNPIEVRTDPTYIGSISFGARGPVYIDEVRISDIARTAFIPEPAALALLSAGGLALIKRRRPHR